MADAMECLADHNRQFDARAQQWSGNIKELQSQIDHLLLDSLQGVFARGTLYDEDFCWVHRRNCKLYDIDEKEIYANGGLINFNSPSPTPLLSFRCFPQVCQAQEYPM